jgi:Phage tail protein (Tail_P2_I)
MSDTTTLLPRNASQQELAIERSMVFPETVGEGVQNILSVKENPKDDALLWLVWEYGLESLLPYITPREAVEGGVEWQRIKGTPESARIALAWLKYGAPAIEEEESSGVHWHEFMVDPGGVPTRDKLTAVKRLSELSAPVGTSLSRIYHGYDLRRFVLDGSSFGDLLSDYSGVYDEEIGVVLSFQRDTDSAIETEADSTATTNVGRLHGANNVYDDRPIWDFSYFGDAAVRNHRFMHAHIFTVRSDGLELFQPPAEKNVLPMAAVVLSDGFTLGDTNSPLFAIDTFEIGAPGFLSDGFYLSGDPWRIEKRPIDKRFDRETESDGAYLFESSTASGGEFFRQAYAFADNSEQIDALGEGTATSAASIRGQFWTGVAWLPQTWAELQFNVRTKHYGNSA